MRASIALLLSLVCAALPATAATQQTRPQGTSPTARPGQAAGLITGAVLNGEGRPLPSASVEIRAAANSALIAGAITGPDGSFRIEGLRPGRYDVRITALGFAPQNQSVTVTPTDPRTDLGPVRLAANALQLEELTVTGERRTATLAPDRNTYTVGDMPAAAGGSAVDVLRNVPSLEVDIDGRVSLRGNENVVVQINGRPTPMRGDQLGNFLAQLPANMVERVEVIPNPSAKYDPEGMAGIVNIALKQNTDLGLSGGVTLGGGTTGQLSGSGDLGYQQGPLTLYGSYGYMQDQREVTGFVYRENRYLDPLTYLEQDMSGAFSPESHTFNGNADYKLGRRDAISANLVVSKRKFERDNENFYRELDASQSVAGRYERLTEGSSDDLSLDYALTYKHTIQPRLHEFSVEARVSRSSDDESTVFTQRAVGSDRKPIGGAPSALETNATDELTRNWTLQADYTRALGQSAKLETGYKGTLRQLDNDFDVAAFSEQQSAYLPDPTRSNAFDYDEQVHAAYGVLSRTAGSFDLQAGLRLEQANTRFGLATTGEAFDNDYRSLFPSALAAYNLDDAHQLKLSYSKRIERPRTRALNPFGRFDDPLNVFRGNPYLKPEYTHAFEAGYQQSGETGTMQLTPFFRRTTDAVRRITTVDDKGVATTTFRNVATNDSYGTDANGSLRLGRVTGFGGISAFKQVTDGSNLGSDVSNDAFGWSARANATWRMSPQLDVQGFFMYRAPMDVEQGRISARSMMNVAVRQKLMGDKASVTLRVVDPFNTMGFASRTSDERFYQESERKFGARGVFLSFNYNFGQQPRVRQRNEGRSEMHQDEMEVP